MKDKKAIQVVSELSHNFLRLTVSEHDIYTLI